MKACPIRSVGGHLGGHLGFFMKMNNQHNFWSKHHREMCGTTFPHDLSMRNRLEWLVWWLEDDKCQKNWKKCKKMVYFSIHTRNIRHISTTPRDINFKFTFLDCYRCPLDTCKCSQDEILGPGVNFQPSCGPIGVFHHFRAMHFRHNMWSKHHREMCDTTFPHDFSMRNRLEWLFWWLEHGKWQKNWKNAKNGIFFNSYSEHEAYFHNPEGYEFQIYIFGMLHVSTWNM